MWYYPAAFFLDKRAHAFAVAQGGNVVIGKRLDCAPLLSGIWHVGGRHRRASRRVGATTAPASMLARPAQIVAADATIQRRHCNRTKR
jgi:hypothetical protein